jgi:hypothetical protein
LLNPFSERRNRLFASTPLKVGTAKKSNSIRMKTERTISIRVNASQRRTGEVTPCAINHKIVTCVDITILISPIPACNP